MALSFAKKGTGGAKPGSSSGDDTPSKPSQAKKPTGSGSTPSWLKTGGEAKQALADAEAKSELAKENAGKMWRFWVGPDDERKITFLDGEVDEDGILAVPMFNEHQVKVNGDWETFVCTQETEGYCPICDRGESKPYLVGVLTVIDHTPHKIKNGPNTGKIIQHTRKIFPAKRTTLTQLSKVAIKRGGLTGVTFEVSRSGDKSAAVGSQFDFVEKQDLDDLMTKYGLEAEGVSPADYGAEIVYRTGEELVALGLGKAHGGVGKEAGVHDKKKLSDQL